MTDDTIIFDRRIAECLGVTEAILLNKIWGWIKHNAKNGTNFHDGRYWTYNSASSYAEELPFINKRTIANILKRLAESNIIVIGNYNKTKFDRTSWYAFSDNGMNFMSGLGYELNAIQPKDIDDTEISNPFEKSANGCEKTANGYEELSNGCEENSRQYQSNNTINKTKKEQSFSFCENEKKEKNDTSFLADQMPIPDERLANVWNKWVAYARQQFNAKSVMLSLQYAKLVEYSNYNASLAEEIVNNAILGGYSKFMPLSCYEQETTIRRRTETEWQ